MKKNRKLLIPFSSLLLLIIILLIGNLNSVDNTYANKTADLNLDNFEESKKNTNAVNNYEDNSISLTILDRCTISINKERINDDFYGVQQLNNRWNLDEIDAILNSIKGVWQADKYIGFIDSSLYYADLFDMGDSLEEGIREELYDQYNEKIKNAKINIPGLVISIKETEGREIDSNYVYINNYYPSPVSIILSLDKINEKYPIFADQTTISTDFYVEYPIIYIKFFVPVEEEENKTIKYSTATLLISKDDKFYLLTDGAFYSLKRKS